MRTALVFFLLAASPSMRGTPTEVTGFVELSEPLDGDKIGFVLPVPINSFGDTIDYHLWRAKGADLDLLALRAGGGYRRKLTVKGKAWVEGYKHILSVESVKHTKD